jgi:hypothetical protein
MLHFHLQQRDSRALGDSISIGGRDSASDSNRFFDGSDMAIEDAAQETSYSSSDDRDTPVLRSHGTNAQATTTSSVAPSFDMAAAMEVDAMVRRCTVPTVFVWA